MADTILPDRDAYDRQVTKSTAGTTATYTAGGFSSGPIDMADVHADARGYAALAAQPPAGFTGVPVSREAVGSFVRTAAADATLSPITRNAVASMYYGLQQSLDAGHTEIIAGMWGMITTLYTITDADKATVHKYALKYGIPGI